MNNECKHKNCENCPDDIIDWTEETLQYIRDHNIWIKFHHREFPCWESCSLNNPRYPRGRDLFGNIV